MKIKVETVFDSETGEYEMKFFNVSNPGESMDYNMIREMLHRIHGNFTHQIDGSPEDLPEDFYVNSH